MAARQARPGYRQDVGATSELQGMATTALTSSEPRSRFLCPTPSPSEQSRDVWMSLAQQTTACEDLELTMSDAAGETAHRFALCASSTACFCACVILAARTATSSSASATIALASERMLVIASRAHDARVPPKLAKYDASKQSGFGLHFEAPQANNRRAVRATRGRRERDGRKPRGFCSLPGFKHTIGHNAALNLYRAVTMLRTSEFEERHAPLLFVPHLAHPAACG
jgi:hypothetical protein